VSRYRSRSDHKRVPPGEASNHLGGRSFKSILGWGGIATHWRQPEYGGICSLCRCDLLAARDGNVYCTNIRCFHSGTAHPTLDVINHGGLV